MIENLKNDCGTLMTGIKLEYWQDVFREKNDLYVIIGEKDTAKKVEAKHENAYGFIVDNQDILLDNIMLGYYDEYKQNRSSMNMGGEKSTKKYLPQIKTEDDIKNNIIPSCINILDVESDNQSYVVFRFVTQLESLGEFSVLTHKNRIVSFMYTGISDAENLAKLDMKNKK
ncbi:MAG: hypothetical protein II388_04725 [Clostridia bacterium]|nr:hypothetical protein [Clostridia bacterium]